MKKLTQEEITEKLHQGHFPRGPEMERLSNPLTDTPMLSLWSSCGPTNTTRGSSVTRFMTI